MLVSLKSLLNKRDASRQVWNCTVGTRMEPGHRVPDDLFNEYLNNWLMQSVSRPEFATLRRNSLALSQIRSIMFEFERDYFEEKSGRHKAPDHQKNLQKLLTYMKEEDVFCRKPEGRQGFEGFEKCEGSLFTGTTKKLNSWIDRHLIMFKKIGLEHILYGVCED
eukprot:sb/3472633/